MQITHAEVTPVELKLRRPVRMAGLPEIHSVTAVFIRMETRKGENAWGCTVAHPALNGETPPDVLKACREAASLVGDLNPLNLEYSLETLAKHAWATPAVMCAYDLAFYDLLSLAAGLPLYRLLGGYRSRIQTSATIPVSPLLESVQMAQRWASQGFRILKVKGGLDPAEDVRRIEAIHDALPNLMLRLDADGGYTVEQAIDVTRALAGILEMIEQPTPPDNLNALGQVKAVSAVHVMADQSLKGPDTALSLAAHHMVHGFSVKLAACGGIRRARQIDEIARAANVTTMVGSVIGPALLTSAGLSLALSSANVRYGDLDGHFDLLNDPSRPGFRLEEGCLFASDVPGLGYSMDL